jgi:hypothetical protein
MHYAFFLSILMVSSLRAQTWNDFETPPHDYWKVPPQDPATLLHKRMEKKEITLAAGTDPKVFLRAYLEALKVPISSQVLVFSKSSLQRDTVTGRNPRALYFNDDTYVGWMPGGLIEVTGIDPVLGGIFYIFNVPNTNGTVPNLERRESCMGCHAGGPTSFLPGLMVRALHTGEDGRTFGEASPSNGGHHTPFHQRWAGWYVTGEPHGMTHQGNRFATRSRESTAAGPLAAIMPPGTHLASGSDVLAMMLHDHQCVAVNYLMEANYRVRTALHASASSLPVADRDIPPGDLEMAETQARRVVDFLLFKAEVPLPAPVVGDSEFRREFAAGARPDKAGRSLRDLSLQTHLLRYRCSYMIYSAAFRGLPAAFQTLVFRDLRRALTSETAGHLPAEERRAIHEILVETLPEYRDV